MSTALARLLALTALLGAVGLVLLIVLETSA
jgi:hypothetical protein